MYYCFSYAGRYNGLLDQNDGSTDVPWYAFCAFGRLYALGSAAFVSGGGEGIYAAAAVKDGCAAVLLSDYAAEDGAITVTLEHLGRGKTVRVRVIDEESPFIEKLSVEADERLSLSFAMEPGSVVLLEID